MNPIRLLGTLLLMAAMLAGPGCDSGNDNGSETHWLTACQSNAECGSGARCICGICTLPCKSSSECLDLGSSASCATPQAVATVCGGTAPSSGICLASCATSADCRSGNSCLAGYCVPGRPNAGPKGGTGGIAGAAGSGGRSSDAGTGGSGGTKGDANTAGATAGVGGGAGDGSPSGNDGGVVADAGRDVSVEGSTGIADTGTDRVDQGVPVGATELALPFPTHGVCSTDGWCWRLPYPMGNSLDAVWGSSDQDVWFSGGPDHSCGGTLMHWDGTNYSGLTCLSEYATVLTGSGPNDVWGLGGPNLIHYDGRSWSKFTTLGDGSAMPSSLTAIHATSRTDAWAVGSNGLLLHWDGAGWQNFDSGGSENLSAVWAFGPKDLWISGTDGAEGKLRHWNGNAWQAFPMQWDQGCYWFWGSAPDDFYCGGVGFAHWNGKSWSGLEPQSSEKRYGPIWGTSSSEVVVVSNLLEGTYRAAGPTLTVIQGSGTPIDTFGSGRIPIRALWASSPGKYIGVGDRTYLPNDGEFGPIWHFDGNQWRPGVTASQSSDPARAENQFSGSPGGATYNALKFFAPNSAWYAAGPKTYLFNGNSMTEIPSGTTENLITIDATSGNDVWAAGENGALIHFDGTSWKLTTVGPGLGALTWIKASAVNDVWVASAVSFFHFDGNAWTPAPPIPPPPFPLDSRGPAVDFFVLGPTDIWQRYGYSDPNPCPYEHLTTAGWSCALNTSMTGSDGGTLLYLQYVGPIWGVRSDDLRLVYGGGVPGVPSLLQEGTLRWDGSTWSVLPDSRMPFSGDVAPVVAARTADDSWIAGNPYDPGGQQAAHWNGQTWSLTTIPTYLGSDVVRGFAWNDVNDVYAYGTGTMLWHYGP